MHRFLIAAVFAASASAACAAPQTFAGSEALDALPVEYTRHNREHRMAEIQWNLGGQRYYRRDRYGDGYGSGYGRRYGGPPPWAPAHGYRRHYYDRW